MPVQDEFGAFFRAKRIALGLPLREFCRRNGLDPGNISRLERGLLSPPRSDEMLDAYADYLKLPPKSEDRQTFRTLAIQESMPKGFRTIPSKARRGDPWVNAADIEAWADLISARSDLPRLIRRLIRATSESTLRIEFAAGEGSQRSGWDGVLQASTANANTPAGLSVWELGTGVDPARKAENDFRSRTKNPLGIRPAEATFIFVTARRWNGKAKWETEKSKLGHWKEVRVLDADSLEAWLEQAPAVDTWFARLLGKRTEGMLDLDEYWKNLAATTEPKLTPSIFLTSRRNSDVRTLEQWLGLTASNSNEHSRITDASTVSGAVSALAIESGAPSDALDFLGAYVANLSDEDRDALTSRIVIVEDIASWNVLCDHQQSLILVAKPSLSLEAEAVSQAVRKGHRVLLASDRFAPGHFQTLALSRPDAFELADALKEAGIEEEAAQKHAIDCSGSLTVLKRRLSRLPATTEPAWSRSEIADKLAPLVLIGCWEDGSTADNGIVSRIMERSYAEVAALVGHAATLPDPPLFRVRGLCSLTSREDSWVLLARRLRDDQLKAWKELAVRVLTDNIPRNVSGPYTDESRAEQEAYSESLRLGIAETLALFAVYPNEVGANRAVDASTVDHIVKRVLGGNPGWRRWAALRKQLPLLAEAAPGAFLDAIESELRAKGGDILQLFADGDDPFFSQCLHSGLLWALETLAWHSSYLLRVSLVLAELSDRDIGKRWANRPMNSLSEIFLPWLPHTDARVEERIKALRKITEKKPTPGWRLLLSLLPSLHGHSMPTHTPKWRNWAANWRARPTNADYAQQTKYCGDRLVEMVGNDAGRWSDLIQHVAALPPTPRKTALSKLSAINVSGISPDDRQNLVEKLRVQIQRHRAFLDARWALPADDIVALEHALNHLESDDPVARNAWLFTDHVELSEPRGPDWSWDEEQKKVASMQHAVVHAIFDQDGIAGVLKLAEAVRAPWLVGELAAVELAIDATVILPTKLVDTDRKIIRFARGYASSSFQIGGWNWVESLRVDQWSAEQLASLATVLPVARKTWLLLEQHSDEASGIYWGSAFLRGITDASDFQYAISQLLGHRRPFAAVAAISTALHGKLDLPAELLLTTLEATLQRDADEPPEDIAPSIVELFHDLQNREPPIDETRLARLEWAYIKVLDGLQTYSRTLHRLLASKPSYFAELLRMIFRPRSELDAPAEEPSAERRALAMNGYRLLASWDQVPGVDANGQTVDGKVLATWIDTARNLCRETGYLEICDTRIGEMLAHAPAEADGNWPCIAVRDVIETVGTPNLSSGLVIGRLNMRGVTMRMPTDGGNLERDEAAKYSDFAKASEAEWPVTASILREIMDYYERRARDEDAQAEVRRLGR